MRGAGDQLSVGDRVAFYRHRRGLTQATLAAMVGRSEDWLSKIERGERQVRRLDVLSELGRALRIPLDDLLGQPVLLEDDQATDDDVPAVREALMSHRRLFAPFSVALGPRPIWAQPNELVSSPGPITSVVVRGR